MTDAEKYLNDFYEEVKKEAILSANKSWHEKIKSSESKAELGLSTVGNYD